VPCNFLEIARSAAPIIGLLGNKKLQMKIFVLELEKKCHG
jgi:hypothetical protein